MPDKMLDTPPARKRSTSEKFRAEMYLTRLDWHLEAVLPGRARRTAIKELRQTLAGDPRDMDTKLRDLGSPRTLAEQYADSVRPRPLWSIGVISAAAALLTYWTIFLSYVFGMFAAVESIGAAEANSRFFTIEVSAFSNAEGFGIGWTSYWSWLVLPAAIAALAFLLGARVWRLIDSRAEMV